MKSSETSARMRKWVPWILRFVLGLALGFGVRMLWERKPSVRFAAGLAQKLTTGSLLSDSASRQGSSPRSPHTRRSLDALAASENPAAMMREWRAELESLPPEKQTEWLNQAVEASAGGFRSFLTRLATDAELRAEFTAWRSVIEALFIRGDPEPLVAGAFRELARLDIGLALDGAEASEFRSAMRAVLEVMAEDDPEAAIAIARTRDDPGARRIIETAVASLAAQSIEKAIPLLMEFASDNSMAAIARIVAAREPVEAFDFCRDERGQLDAGSVWTLADEVPAHRAGEFFRTLEKLAPDIATTHVNAAARLLQMMARSDSVEAIQWVEKNWPEARGATLHERNQVLSAAAAAEPALAVRALAESIRETDPKSASYAGFLDGALQAWMAQDHESALDWVMNEQRWIGNRARGVFAELPGQAFEQAGRRIDGHTSIESRSALRRMLVSAWSSHDPAAALAYADSIPEPSERSALRMSALCHWFSADPLAASATAVNLSPAERGEVATSLSNPLSPRFLSAPGFAKLIESPIELNPGYAGTFAAGLSTQVSLGNTEGAMAVLDSLPLDVRSNVATEFAWLTARNHPELAWRSLDHVNEPIERMDLETRLLRRRWNRADGPTD